MAAEARKSAVMYFIVDIVVDVFEMFDVLRFTRV